MQALRDKNLLNLYMKELEEEKDILSFCQSNKYLYEQFCTDNYLQSFMQKRYPGIEKYKKSNETWKQYFLRFVYYKAILKEKYDFNYENGNIEAQYKLLNKYSEYEKYSNPIKKPALDNFLLVGGIKENSFSLVNYALEKGADINGVSTHGWEDRPLTIAVKEQNLDMVKHLIEKGADIKYTLLNITETSPEILSYIFEEALHKIPFFDPNDFKNRNLIKAVVNGKYDIVKYLLDNGADIHTENDKALREASAEGKIKVVRLLLERGADIHANNDQALRLAARGGHLQVVKRLLEYGANPLIFTEAELSKLNPMISEVIYKSKF